MKRESPFSSYRFIRELQYAFAYYLLNVQHTILGNSKSSIEITIEKSILSGIQKAFGKIRSKFFGKLVEPIEFDQPYLNVIYDPEFDYSKYRRNSKSIDFPEGTVKRNQLSNVDKEIFDFLDQDWNQVYKETRDKSTILGYIAEYMLGKGENPDDLSQMTLPEVSNTLENKYNFPGLENIDELIKSTGLSKDRVYQLIYANAKGAEWLAVYDDLGQRSGKSYDLVTRMYRQQIAEALARNATIGEIRSIMISPDDDLIKDALGLFDENLSESQRLEKEREYEEIITNHLNRDMGRFAFTEVMINANNGRLIQLLHESKSSTPMYVKFQRVF